MHLEQAIAALALGTDTSNLPFTPCTGSPRCGVQVPSSATELPASRARIGSFEQLRQANDELLNRALKELAEAGVLHRDELAGALRALRAQTACGISQSGSCALCLLEFQTGSDNGLVCADQRTDIG